MFTMTLREIIIAALQTWTEILKDYITFPKTHY